MANKLFILKKINEDLGRWEESKLVNLGSAMNPNTDILTLKIVDTDTYPNEDPTKPKFRRFI